MIDHEEVRSYTIVAAASGSRFTRADFLLDWAAGSWLACVLVAAIYGYASLCMCDPSWLYAGPIIVAYVLTWASFLRVVDLISAWRKARRARDEA